MASDEMKTLKVGMKMMMERGFAPKFDGTMDPIHLRHVVQAAQERMATEPDVTFVPRTYAGIEAEISMPKEAKDDYVIVYIHGGGLICGNAFSSRGYASMLAGESKRPVISFSYRLAPEDPFPAAVEDCFAADARFRRVAPMERGPEEWTEFETMFRAQGLPIHAAAWEALEADDAPLAPLTIAPEDEPREGVVRRESRGKEWREEHADGD